jgi:hypothetical protein
VFRRLDSQDSPLNLKEVTNSPLNLKEVANYAQLTARRFEDLNTPTQSRSVTGGGGGGESEADTPMSAIVGRCARERRLWAGGCPSYSLNRALLEP